MQKKRELTYDRYVYVVYAAAFGDGFMTLAITIILAHTAGKTRTKRIGDSECHAEKGGGETC